MNLTKRLAYILWFFPCLLLIIKSVTIIDNNIWSDDCISTNWIKENNNINTECYLSPNYGYIRSFWDNENLYIYNTFQINSSHSSFSISTKYWMLCNIDANID